MKEYIRLHQNSILLLSAGILLCGITGTFTIPYAFRQWEADRSISLLKVTAGLLLGIGGGTILFLLFIRRFRYKEGWIKKTLLLCSIYILVQSLAGSLFGAVGLLSYQKLGTSYDKSQTLMDICIAVWQNFIRVFFLYLLISWKNDVDWKLYFKKHLLTFLVAACLAAIPIMLNVFASNIFTKCIGLIWACVYIVSFYILFDKTSGGTE
jgi:hypothetical protein